MAVFRFSVLRQDGRRRLIHRRTDLRSKGMPPRHSGCLRSARYRQHHRCGIRDRGNAIARLSGDGDGVGARRRCVRMRRTVLIVVVERLARGCTQHGHEAHQRDERNTLQPTPPASSPRETAQTQHTGQENGPGDRAAPKRRPRGRTGEGGYLFLRLNQHGADGRATRCRRA